MSLSEELAKTCILAKSAESYPAFAMPPVPGLPPSTPEQVRDAFENSVVDEEALRAKAQRFGSLAQRRADNNEETAGGAFTKRLLPVPHTGGEAAWRLPLVGLGGIAGHGAGNAVASRFATPSVEAIHEVVNKENGPLASRISDELTRGGATAPADQAQAIGVSPEQAHQAVATFNSRQAMLDKYKLDLAKIDSTAAAINNQMQAAMHGGADPKAIEKFQAALQKLEISKAGITGPMQLVEKELAGLAAALPVHKAVAGIKPERSLGSLTMPGPGGVKPVGHNAEQLLSTLRGMRPEETRSILGPIDMLAKRHPSHAHVHSLMADSGLNREKLLRLIDSIKPTPRGPWAGRAGAAAGALGAGALTGLPLAIRAAKLNATGGEAAQRARDQMRGSIEGAEKEQFKRENMLRSLEGTEQMPNKEFRHARNASRKNWKESIKGYRKGMKASVKSEKKTGSPVATEKKKDADESPAEKRSAQMLRMRSKLAALPTDFQGSPTDVALATADVLKPMGQLSGLQSPLKYPAGAARSAALMLPKGVGDAVNKGVTAVESKLVGVDKKMHGAMQAGASTATTRAQQIAAMAKKFLFRK